MDSIVRHERRSFPTWAAIVGAVTIIAVALMVMYNVMWMWTAGVALVGVVLFLFALRDYSRKHKGHTAM